MRLHRRVCPEKRYKHDENTRLQAAMGERMPVEYINAVVTGVTGNDVRLMAGRVPYAVMMSRYIAILIMHEEGYNGAEIGRFYTTVARNTIYNTLVACNSYLNDTDYRLSLTLDFKATYLAVKKRMAEIERGEAICA